MTRPLVLNGDAFEEVDGIPPGVNPTWVDDETIAWETGSASRDFVIRLFNLDGDALTPPLPGHEPTWLSGIERLAVQGDPEQGFDRIATFGLDLDVARDLRSQARPDGSSPSLSSSWPCCPCPPTNSTTTAAASSSSRQPKRMLNVTCRSSTPTAATPKRWWLRLSKRTSRTGRRTAESSSFVSPCRRLGLTKTLAIEADIIIYDPEAASEEVVGSGTGILSLAACT